MLLALPIASRAKDVFYIQPFNIVPGDTKTISLNLDNANGYRGFQTDIVLPEGLSIVKQTNNSLAISPTSRASSFALSFNEIGDRTTRLLCYSAQYETISGNSGALVNIQVKASSDFAGGYVQLKNTIFSNENNQDVNMDDSQVSVQTKEQNFISVADDEVTAGKGKAFALQLTNETSLTACQFDVAVPSGLSLDLEKCSVTGRCSSSHQLTSKDLGNGRYRFVCMSMDNTTFVGHSGTILNLWVNAEASARDHKKVKVENVVFSDAKAQTYRFEPISFDVNVSFVVATSIRLSESSLSLQVDDSRTLTATVLPENCTDKSVVWESSNEQVATVDANGKVIAKAEGQCQIIAYSADRSVKAECAVTVTKIPLTVRVEDVSRKYGDENPQFKISYEGFRDGDTETRLTTSAVAQTDANLKSAVGDYEIILSGAESNKYSFNYVAGTLTITKAPLTISADNYTKKQGDAMPEFKASYSGFKNGETESVLTKQPVFSTDANEASSPAEYAVNVSSAEAENYEISYQPGTLTVTEADAVIIRAKNYTRQYGDANPVFEYEVEGAALEGTPELTCSAVANSPVGTYTIELSKGSVKNYNVHFENGTMTITKAPLTISAGNYTKKQGDAMPAFKASYDGFKNGETESVLTKQPVFSTDANEASSPAEYAVNVSSAEAENYEISYQPGTMTVTEADAVVIRAKSYRRQYGDANPTFEYEVEGVALDGTPELVCSAAVGSSIGTYTIEVRQGSVKNYNVHFENGTLTITKAPLVISAGSYTKKQGDAMPEFKASYSGFKNGETEAVLTKQPVFSTEANESSSPADYVVNVSGAEADNYDITYLPGILTITEMSAPIVSIVNNELQISTELDNAVIYYTLDGTEPDENSKVYSEPVSLYASCMIKAIAAVGGVKSKVTETEFHDALYPDIVKVGDLITANIINNGEENLLMAFKVTSVFPFEVTMIHRSNYQEGWNNEQITGDIEVPSSVTANGISYSVKRIGDSALAYTPKAASLKLNEGLEYIDGSAFRCFGQLKMKELVVPNSVKVVGGAFVTECNSLNTIVLGTGVERLQRDAFWGIGALKEIYSLNSIPPVCDVPDQTFVDIPDDVALYVPIGSKEAYETAPGWNHFAGHIVEINPTAIKPVVISIKDNTSWYNLRGVRSLEKPTAPGIYIHGGKKVIIK